ncbi:hypothetical protein BKK49_07020 [Rodentibacter rarus]|uniref:replication protein n=1 Tax=Rodentibacter rarus TaxID=1908260 RepID=UPI0009CE55B1|nr:replication protein [Rodentibacter rarus]OOF39871.1 hypothetical protein BKK49_07020 [Rodentibacter rarus]
MSRFIPNSFQVPNAIIDEVMAELSGAELKCYLAILRKTKGWGKESDAISVTQLMDVTGLSNRAVIDACNHLVEKNLISQDAGSRGVKIFSVNLCNNFTSEKSSPVKKVHSTSEKSSPVTSEESSHTENNIKNTTQNTDKKTTQKIAKAEKFEFHFEKFWSAGMRKVGKEKALKKFKSAYKGYNADYPISIEDFTQMLIDDIAKRLRLRQFGFDNLHPSTYLNNWRWLDDYPQEPVEQKTGKMPSDDEFADNGTWSVGRKLNIDPSLIPEYLR